MGLEDRLATRLGQVPGLVVAYLFGSRARGDHRLRSDADIAVLLARTPTCLNEYPFDLAGELETELGIPVDVVVLNGAPPDLVHRVLRDGVLLVDKDPTTRIAFEVRSRNEYFDLAPIREAYRRPRGATQS